MGKDRARQGHRKDRKPARPARRMGRGVKVGINLPAGMQARQTAEQQVRFYWRPRPKDIAAGFRPKSKALGADLAAACRLADRLNADLVNWRNGVERTRYEPGTLVWLINEFEQSRAYRNLSRGAQVDYSRNLSQIADLKARSGQTLHRMPLKKLTSRKADRIYERQLERGSRTAAYSIATIRKAWNAVRRLYPEHVPEQNPFENMGISHKAKETRPATFEELKTFTSKAISMGEIGMAIAAQAAWDLCTRPDEIFSRFAWAHWRPESHPLQCHVSSAKNDHGAWVYVVDPETGESYYPELDALMRTAPRKHALVITRRRQTGAKVHDDWLPIANGAKKARDIRKAAGLGDHVTIAAFRHGGLTELGEGGLSDSLAQALSRHRQRQTLDHYLHRSDPMLLEAARKRNAYRKAR